MTEPGTRRGRILKTVQRVAAGMLLILGLVWAWARLSFDRDEWLADYDQLRAHVSSRYANLLWTIDERGVDPRVLHERTLAGLEAANTDRQARAVIASFVAAFDDAHFRVHRIKLSDRLEAWWRGRGRDDDEDAEPPGPSSSPADVCAALGVHDDPGEPSVGLADAPGVTRLGGEGSLPTVIVEHERGRIGVIRIPLFSQARYRTICERAWSSFAAELDGACDDDCLGDFFHRALADAILADLRARVVELDERGIELLAIDITGNGGGTDWVDPAARMLSAKPLACPRVAFIKDPHWGERLAALRAEVVADLERAGPQAADRELLREADARLGRLLEQVEQPCDLGGIWTGARPACSNLVTAEHYACGLFPRLEPGSLAELDSRTALFDPLRYSYDEGVWTGPLAVVIDRHTASASEYFAATLADNEAAELVGERSLGVGCGYTGGGVPALLEHSELRVEMPDCQRLRADGSNELAGITPDIALSWASADDDARRDSLLEALVSLLPE